jgi:hypothetical protein
MFIVMNRTFILLYGMTVSSLLRMCVCTCTVQRTKPPSKTVGIQGPTVAREPRKKMASASVGHGSWNSSCQMTYNDARYIERKK